LHLGGGEQGKIRDCIMKAASEKKRIWEKKKKEKKKGKASFHLGERKNETKQSEQGRKGREQGKKKKPAGLFWGGGTVEAVTVGKKMGDWGREKKKKGRKGKRK